MSPAALFQLLLATGAFVTAANVAKSWALAPNLGKVLLALALYTAGNLIMLRLIKLAGMATAFSLSAVLQLVAVNALAVLVHGERLGTAQGLGIVLAIVAVVLITLGPTLP